MRKKNLIIDEYPLLVLPSLATSIGLNEAIALQQLHYWLENPKGGIEMDGFRWVYNTYENWQKDNFPFWSVRTVQRVFTNLEDLELVISKQQANYDRKKYYRVHYDNLASWNETNCRNAEFQDGGMQDAKVASSLTETTSETTTDITQPEEKISSGKGKKKVSKETQEAVLKMGGIGWMVAAGEQVDQSVIDEAVLANDARNTFEKVFGFGTLPWSSNDVWTKFEKLVIKAYKENPGWIADYVFWRNGVGKYSAFSNRKIRENPQMFIDTGYPEYQANKMYRKTDELQVSYAGPKRHKL